jgi:hypothetical protein
MRRMVVVLVAVAMVAGVVAYMDQRAHLNRNLRF